MTEFEVYVKSFLEKCRSAKIALPIVPVIVSGKNYLYQNRDYTCTVETFALLDPCSDQTFCSIDLYNDLCVKGDKTCITLETLGNVSQANVNEISLDVLPGIGKYKPERAIRLNSVYAVNPFPDIDSNYVTDEILRRWPHLRKLYDDNVPIGKVSLLIGQDNPSALRPLEVISGHDSEPFAVRTKLGWTLNGPLDYGNTAKVHCNFTKFDTPAVTLETQVQQFWRLDDGLDLASECAQMSQEDIKTVKFWKDTIVFRDGNYILPIPFRCIPYFPDNLGMCIKRAKALKRKLMMNPVWYRMYCESMQALIDNGFAEEISLDSLKGNCVWYIPHHGVVHPQKPGVIRPVFDCPASLNGHSLNGQVMSGPDNNNRLLGVLLRFREGPIAFMCDVKAMFHCVKLPVEQRDYLRLLWWEQGDLDKPLKAYRMTAHIFGGVWSPSAATFALRHHAETHRTDYSELTIDTVLDNMYVDDCLRSLESVDCTIKICHELMDLLDKGGFPLTKWVSNSPAVIDSIPVERRAKGVKDLDLDSERLPIERALGTVLDCERDCFTIVIKVKDNALTRRGLLKTTSSIFDPMGTCSPYILQAKVMLQNECKLRKGWDDKLEPDTLKKWQKWLSDLPQLQSLSIDRCFVPPNFEGYTATLHFFSDASQVAYGLGCYLRIVNPAGNIHVSFVLGKSRLAPVKHVTIPRLELLGATQAVRMNAQLLRELRIPLQDSVFWTDSLIVLHYIENDQKRYQTFVANRVNIIRSGSRPDQWRFVDSLNNAGDDASCGLPASEVVSPSSRWRRGPEFLYKTEEHWPTRPDSVVNDSDLEVKCRANFVAKAIHHDCCIANLIQRHNSWYGLKRSVAWLRRFISWLKHRSDPTAHKGALKVNEIK